MPFAFLLSGAPRGKTEPHGVYHRPIGPVVPRVGISVTYQPGGRGRCHNI